MPDGKTHRIADDAALKLARACVSIYNLDYIDIEGELLVRDDRSFEEMITGAGMEGDDHLGVQFRDDENRAYLSDNWDEIIVEVGQCWKKGKHSFVEDLRKYAAARGFDFIIKKNDHRLRAICDKGLTKAEFRKTKDIEYMKREAKRNNYVVGCAQKPIVRRLNMEAGADPGDPLCKWYVRGRVIKSTGFFFITAMRNEHTCGRDGRKLKHPRIDSEMVSKCIHADISHNSKLRPKDIQSNFKEIYGFQLTHKVAKNAKAKAKFQVYGDEDCSFDKLIWYKNELQKTNPGSYFDIELENGTNKFKRAMCAYNGSIEGFKNCIPVLYVDGTFGRSRYKGQILVAIGKDGNNGKEVIYQHAVYTRTVLNCYAV
jgi:hypothetical protein